MNKIKLLIATLVLSIVTIVIPLSEEVKAEVNPDAYVPMSEADLAKYLKFTKVGGGYSVGTTSSIGSGYKGEIHIPATYLEEPVIGVDRMGFYSAKASKIIFEEPQKIITIGDSSFYNINISNELDFQNLSVIPNGAFQNAKLKLKLNPNKITTIGDSAFYNFISDSTLKFNIVSHIPSQAFREAKITKIQFNPNTVDNIGSHAFYSFYSPKSELIFPLVSSIKEHTFYGSSLKSIVLSDTVNVASSDAMTQLNQATYVYLNNAERSKVKGPVHYGFIKYDTTPLGIELDMGGIFTQHRVVMTPVKKDGSVDTSKTIREVKDDRRILYAGTDFDYDTAYTVTIYPLLNDVTTKIVLPMDPFKKHVVGLIDLKIIRGGLTMHLSDDQVLNGVIDMSQGYVSAEINNPPSLIVKDFRGEDSPWTLQLSLAPLYDKVGNEIDFLDVYAEGLTVSQALNSTPSGELEYNVIKPNDNKSRLLGKQNTDINPGGGFGTYDHKFDKFVLSIDPRKVDIDADDTELDVQLAMIWTIATEL